ncbi:apolipoprotein N-acyltransferase [Hymenobacter psoromatis]|uniref:apolipoprotein N-acyltransferase n=1 Tax=Hymenobacter psoromatis TaxID=1484116 RepID=UPI001CBCC82C|nr:apolipoprotein N-acyltransferase [Hymenobacter psoromatis]
MTPPPSFWQRPLVLGSLSALLLCGGWPPYPSAAPALLLFIGWVPYLLMERQLTLTEARKGRVFACTYWLLLVWNALTTWWVSFSTLGGGIAAVVLNALLMCLPLMAFRQTKKRFGNRLGYLSLPIYWIAFEQLHLHWDLTWPWLTLGNGFAAAPQWVQWYEYTGFLGGSVWVWVVNLLVFWAGWGPQGVPFWALNGPRRWRWGVPMAAIWLPIIVSTTIGRNYQEKGSTAEVVVVQPNFDPYVEKFEGGTKFISPNEQLTRFLQLSEQHLTPATRLIIWPETALEEAIWENTVERDPKIQRIRVWLGQHPGVALLTGITTVGSYPNKEAASATARYRDDLGYYDTFNAGAYFASATAPIAFYHKSRLVPGVENVPPVLTALVSHIDLGGYVGSYGSQTERTVFAAPANAPALRIAPIICYESIYGDFVSEYIPNGATLLALFTNDAWWHDSPGYRQLLRYGSLRCIETRRDLARAANTGFTGFINQKGEIYQQVPAWIATASRGTVHLNNEVTFYARFGELIGRAAQLLAVLGIVAVVGWMLRARVLNH